MNPLNVLSSEVALRLVNRHIGPQGVQLTALLVCSGGSFHERTEVVLRKVTLLSKKLMFVIIYLYSLEVDLTKLSVCLKRILLNFTLLLLLGFSLDSLDAVSSRVAMRLLN